MGIQLITGLGNPGVEYQATRHNIGWWFVDILAEHYGVAFRHEKRFHGEVAKVQGSSDSDVYLLKPGTFMNRSGMAVRSFSQFFKIPLTEVLVVHDELDLSPGMVKLKYSGGHGGHNGLRDIISQTGERDFYRLRLGIGHPGNREQVTGFVLGKPAAAERDKMYEAMESSMVLIPEILAGNFQQVMNSLHRKQA